jgi:hypothetical protein
MRHFTLATALAFAMAATFSIAAKADMGGPSKNDQGQCRVYGANNQNSSYYHWEACPKPAAAVVTHKPHHKKG